jgi:hypothetical protein
VGRAVLCLESERVGNEALHGWVRTILGAARICAKCNTDRAKLYDWAHKSGLYRRDLSVCGRELGRRQIFWRPETRHPARELLIGKLRKGATHMVRWMRVGIIGTVPVDGRDLWLCELALLLRTERLLRNCLQNLHAVRAESLSL